MCVRKREREKERERERERVTLLGHSIVLVEWPLKKRVLIEKRIFLQNLCQTDTSHFNCHDHDTIL